MKSTPDPSHTAAPLRGEWRVALVLIIGLVLLEGGMRWWVRTSDSRVRRDHSSVRSLAQTADEMRVFPGHKVLLVGNSLTRDGVEDGVVRDALATAGRKNPGVFPCHPSGTSACTWDYALHRYFLRPDVLPDEIFIFAGPGDLEDTKDEAMRLRNFYVDPRDFTRAWSWDLQGSESCVRFLAAQVSQLSGMDPMLKLRVLDRLVPHYMETEQLVNRLVWDRIQTPSSQKEAATYKHLTFLLDALHARRIRTHVVIMPTIYRAAPFDPAAAGVIAAHGMDLFDLSIIPGMDASRFSDGFHLNLAGAHLFSTYLASEVIAHLH